MENVCQENDRRNLDRIALRRKTVLIAVLKPVACKDNLKSWVYQSIRYLESVSLAVIAGLAVGIMLILTFVVLPVPDNSPQGVYDRNFARITADADCIEPECAYENIAYCEVGTKSVIPSDENHVWIINVESYDIESCTYVFEETNVMQRDIRYADFIIYECRAFAEDLRKISANSTDVYIQKIIAFYGERCGIAVP